MKLNFAAKTQKFTFESGWTGALVSRARVTGHTLAILARIWLTGITALAPLPTKASVALTCHRVWQSDHALAIGTCHK